MVAERDRKLVRRTRLALATAVLVGAASVAPFDVAASPSALPGGIAWRTDVLAPRSVVPLRTLVSTSSAGRRTWTVRGACRKVNDAVRSYGAGTCTIGLKVAAKGRKQAAASRRSFRIAAVTPVSDTIGASPAVWFPAAPPEYLSADWSVPIASYVRGTAVYPLGTGLPAAEDAACTLARRAPRGVVVLSFGRQVAGGASGFGTTISYDDLALVATAWAAGLARCGTGPWELALGTSNSGGASDFNGYTGGAAWAQLVTRVRTLADSRVIVAGAVDLEPSWGPAERARRWVSGFVATSAARLWNFGSADGCPQTWLTTTSCNNRWTIDDVIWVSSGAGPNVVVAPQIHTASGSQARQWAILMRRALDTGVEFRLLGLSVQSAACAQTGGCRSTDTPAWVAWQLLRAAIDAHPTISGSPLAAPFDIRWGWSGDFFVPPDGSTTTTSTSSSTTSTSIDSSTTTETSP